MSDRNKVPSPIPSNASLNRAMLIALLVAVELMAGACIAYVGLDWRSPLIVSGREKAFVGLIQFALVLSVIAVVQWTVTSRNRGLLRLGAVYLALFALTGVAGSLSAEARFRAVRAKVLEKGAQADLNGLGGHLIVGYKSEADIQRLISNGVVAGVFITTRNIVGRTPTQIASGIAGWQATRIKLGLPPLFITADQEGGLVSHLSPPLKRRASLADAIVAVKADRGCDQTQSMPACSRQDKRSAIARAYGQAQGEELAGLGVNVNFAPVVDLNFGVRGRNDAHTRIYKRAIARDPALVTQLARAYCEGLQSAGVVCTLKHFPGLGRVTGDTHVSEARLGLPMAELEKSDLMPFSKLIGEPNRMTMLSHVRLTAVDADAPVSLSGKVVTGLLRGTWKHSGILVTDDITMRAAYASGRKRGMGSAAEAAIRALNAGVDLVLISFDTDQVYPVLQALADAYGNGTLGRDQLIESRARLAPLYASLTMPAASRYPQSDRPTSP